MRTLDILFVGLVLFVLYRSLWIEWRYRAMCREVARLQRVMSILTEAVYNGEK